MAVGLLIFATGIFVAAEFALVASDRGRVEAMAEAGNRRARMARDLLRRTSFHLSGAQFGITVASLLLGFIAEPSIAHLLEPVLGRALGPSATHAVAIVIALLLATFLEMVLGELVPKTLAIASPERAALLLAPFLRIYGLIFGPLIRVLNGAANAMVRSLGIEPKEELQSVRTLSELEVLIQTSADEGTIAGSASKLLTRSIRFTEKCAAEVLVPRVELHGISADDSVADLVALAVRTGHSRFPVFRGDLDDIVGVVMVKAVHALPPAQRAITSVSTIMTEAHVVPESRDLQALLHVMQSTRNHLVVVVDEYGGTAGIVTLEDLLEEIVGEIDDEHDALTPQFVEVVSAKRGVIAGGMHPDEVEEATGFQMPEGDYETLAGFVLDQLGHVPGVGEVVLFDGWTVEVVGMEKHRITEVRVVAPIGDGVQQEDEGSERDGDGPMAPNPSGGGTGDDR